MTLLIPPSPFEPLYKMLRPIIFVVTLLLGTIFAADEDTDIKDTVITPSGLMLPPDAWALATQGAWVAAGLASGLVVIAGVAYLLMPLFGLRPCALFNLCDPLSHYGNGYGFSPSQSLPHADFTAYSNQGTYGGPMYPLRTGSQEGPVYNAVNTGYEKYSQPIMEQQRERKRK